MNRKDIFILFAFVIIITAFSIFNTGYEPVHSDEITYLSIMKYHDDPSLYSKDFLISQILPGLPIPFYTLMGFMSGYINQDLLFLSVFVITRVLLVLSVFFLAQTLFKNKNVSYWSVIAVLIIRGNIGMVPGSYDILDRIASPFFLAAPILLFSLTFFLKSRYTISSFLLAASFYLHTTTSIFLLLLYGFYFLINFKKINKKVILSFIVFLALAFPILFKSLMTKSPVLNFDQWIHFLTLRVSGHFFPTTWPFINTSLFFILVAMFIVSLRYKPDKTKSNKVIVLSWGTLLLLSISFIFTEIHPVIPVIQASLFRGIVIFRVIALIFVINFIIASFKYNYRKILASGMAMFLVSTAVVPIFTGEQKGLFSDVNISKEKGLWEDVSLKAKELTQKDSLFITPPFSLGFTFFSERSEFINWKTSGVGVYSGKFVAEAVKRFKVVCKHEFDFSTRTELVEECKKGYERLNKEDFELAKEEYGITHIIVERPKQLNLSLIYENEGYRIYEL